MRPTGQFAGSTITAHPGWPGWSTTTAATESALDNREIVRVLAAETRGQRLASI